jgi:hypothetical protein
MPCSVTGPIKNKVVCTTSYFSVGCTFIDWSLHYLSGQDHYYSVAQHSAIPLVANPIGATNAHLHERNHPRGIKQTRDYIAALSNNDLPLNSFYPNHMRFYQGIEDLGFQDQNIRDPGVTEKIFEYLDSDYNGILSACGELGVPVIYVDIDKKFDLYLLERRAPVADLLTSDHRADSDSAAKQEFYNVFFHDDKFPAEHIWDLREKLALSLNPLDHRRPKINFAMDHFWVHALDLFTQGRSVFPEIMKFLDLSIESSRWQPWLDVYHQWSDMQLSHLKFSITFDHIIDCIVNGWHYPLDLSFYQEIVIQHALIYRHNLNIKNWQLEKFPSDTQLLHQLLTANEHPLLPVYI